MCVYVYIHIQKHFFESFVRNVPMEYRSAGRIDDIKVDGSLA
jgi:hypothetical protein